MKEWDFHGTPRGLRLRVCEWGEGEPVLVLHGYLEQGAAWSEVARHLPHRRVVAPDQRGHGLSEHIGRGGWYHFFDYLPDIIALIDTLGGPIDLVGHSMGSTVACLVAATCPDRVRRLVLVEGIGPPDMADSTLRRPRRFVDAALEPPKHRPLASVEAAADRMRRFNPRLAEARAIELAARITRPCTPDEGPAGSLVWTWDPLHRGRNPTAFSARTFERFLTQIEAPTTVLWGSDSGFLASEREGRLDKLQKLVRQADVPDAGHLAHHDAPEALAAEIAKALA
ncbi:MAG: alpha/beta hydrolase [Proteobacteria bacterium]|nr:alpha/beta hydrolase [Pseudomonadota bacterium]